MTGMFIMRQQIIKILSKPRQIPRRIANKLTAISTNFFLNKKCKIKHNGKFIFTMRDFGDITKMRIITFATKEPETLNWIDGFKKGEKLLDVGANIGVYSLYAAVHDYDVVAIEPNALNFALLNLNIFDNKLGERITAYPYSIHADSKISVLNNDLYKWGGAASSFDRNMDWLGKEMRGKFKQGSPGISIDDLVEKTQFFPNHIKIDVDGNELLVLQGAIRTLNDVNCKSILIELFDGHSEYQQCINILTKNGFSLVEKTHAPMFSQDILATHNHIFIK